MSAKKNKDGRSKGAMSKTGADLAMRGNAVPQSYWDGLMPNARAKAVAMGLFTQAGEITEKGWQMLQNLAGQSMRPPELDTKETK